MEEDEARMSDDLNTEDLNPLEEADKACDQVTSRPTRQAKRVRTIFSPDDDDEDVEDEDDDSNGVDDADWQPRAKKRYVTPKEKRTDVSVPNETAPSPMDDADPLSCNPEGINRGPQSPPTRPKPVPLFKDAAQKTGPLYKDAKRKTKQSKDAEEDIIQSDDLLYCLECSRDYDGDCPEHGPVTIIEDLKMPSLVSDAYRAKKTAPSVVSVADSKIPGAESGVWARETIQPRTRFGPYGGNVVPPDSASSYSWLIRKDGKPSHCVDAAEPGLSNWMRYVNLARHEGESNLHAYQYKGNIYYQTKCRVNPHEELLLWNGHDSGGQQGATAETTNDKAPETFKDLSKDEDLGRLFVKNETIIKEDIASEDPVSENALSLPADLVRSKWAVALEFPADVECPRCNVFFPDEETYSTHLLIHAGEDPLICFVCNERFFDDNTLSHHIQSVHEGIRSFDCNYCNQRFLSSDALSSHLLAHVNGRVTYLYCTECGGKFDNDASFKAHAQLCEKAEYLERLICQVCNVKYSSEDGLAQHILIHKTKKYYQCADCKLNCDNIQGFRSHLRRVHQRDNRLGCLTAFFTTKETKVSFACCKCKLTFPGRSDFVEHMAKQHERDDIVFEHCNSLEEIFKDNISEKETCRPKCDKCNSNFSSKSSLRRHMSSVHGSGKTKKVLACEPAVWASPSKSGKKFKCHLCKSVFNQKSKLSVHIIIAHASKRQPYRCEPCVKGFPSEDSLIDHRRKVHPDGKPSSFLPENDPLICDFCCDNFMRREDYDEHVPECEENPDAVRESPQPCDKNLQTWLQNFRDSIVNARPREGNLQTSNGNSQSRGSNPRVSNESLATCVENLQAGENPQTCDINPRASEESLQASAEEMPKENGQKVAKECYLYIPVPKQSRRLRKNRRD